MKSTESKTSNISLYESEREQKRTKGNEDSVKQRRLASHEEYEDQSSNLEEEGDEQVWVKEEDEIDTVNLNTTSKKARSCLKKLFSLCLQGIN